MPRQRPKELSADDGDAIRHLVAAIPSHADVYAILQALEVLASTLTAMDSFWPDPEKRAMVRDAQRLAKVMRTVNATREYVEQSQAGRVDALARLRAAAERYSRYGRAEVEGRYDAADTMCLILRESLKGMTVS